MKKTGANYVLITSIVWAAILACVLLYFLRRHEVRTTTTEASPTPMLAVGPEVFRICCRKTINSQERRCLSLQFNLHRSKFRASAS